MDNGFIVYGLMFFAFGHCLMTNATEEPEPTEEEIHYQMCDYTSSMLSLTGYLKKEGMLERMKHCYNSKIPEKIKKINDLCKNKVGQEKLTDEQFWMKNCEKEHSETYLKFENCTGEQYIQDKIDDDEAEYLMGPFIDCLIPEPKKE